MNARVPFFAVRHQPPTGRRWLLMTLSFLIPLGGWCAVSYLPFLWHPLQQIEIGGAPTFTPGDRIPRAAYADVTAADNAWFASWQDNGAMENDKWIPGPGQRPAASGRGLNRANTRALYTYAPALIANGYLSSDDERNVDAIGAAVQAWSQASPPFSGGPLKLSQTNVLRLSAVNNKISLSEGTITMPEAAILPAAALQGFPANPVFLPAPHEVGMAFVTAFTTPPPREADPWLHERIVHSLWIVVKGFGLALLCGLPLGVLAGSFPSMSRLIEPFSNLIGYIPPPAFAALLVAIFGLQDGPKVGIVFIASLFPMITMVANTVRSLDPATIEAAQTLGASKKSLLTRVIIPGAMPRIFDDLRVLLALGWTILIIAEVTGEKSGISAYMEQQSRYRNYDFVFVAMGLIGALGLFVDQTLASLKPKLFPWTGGKTPWWLERVTGIVGYFPRLAAEAARDKDAAVSASLAHRRTTNGDQS